MIAQYILAVSRALTAVLDLVIKLAMPLSICAAALLLAGALVLAFQRDNQGLQKLEWRRKAGSALGYFAVALLVVASCAALRITRPLARMDMNWRESAEATANPVPDASPVSQSGPALASLSERTYTRTLTLPPEFLRRIGAEGLSVLAPYLSDPESDDVLRQVDRVRRKGRDAIFTRQVTRLDEEPIPFTNSQVWVKFRRLAGRAYDSVFEAHYEFRNTGTEPISARFQFTMPEAGTVRDIAVAVGKDAIREPNEEGAYQWLGRMKPGESRLAVVRYRVIGSRSWQYDLGSRRRRVQQFSLEADTDGPVRFLRGSLQPTDGATKTLRWELASVVTAQQIALAFPPDTIANQSYLQALSAFPASFLLFGIGVLALGFWRREVPDAARLAGVLVLFAFGLGTATVIANYLPHLAGILIGPLAGAFLTARVLGRRSLAVSLPAALLPATFLSPQNSGIWVLILTIAMFLALLKMDRPRKLA